MTRPRSSLVSLEDTPWYHCVSRCVRRAFLCGEDPVTGVSFEHRRGWIADRIQQLASIFAIDVAAYAVMSNHYHVVVRVDAGGAAEWSTDEVLDRWTQLFSGPRLVARYRSSERDSMDDAELGKVEELAEIYRSRLHDLSWFMRTLNEFIARRANKEDGVTGRFWEGRFKTQALLDEQALLAAMAYVDLNPVRAGIAETPEDSDFTSIQERLGIEPEAKAEGAETPRDTVGQADGEAPALPRASLMPFDAAARLERAVPFEFLDYLELVDWTGRAVRPDKRGFIPEHQPQILERLGIDGQAFIQHADHLLASFGRAVGIPEQLAMLRARHRYRHLRGMRVSRRVFGQAR